MHPKLFTFPEMIPLIGGRGIHIYGLMIAFAFLFAIWWARREARREGLNENRMLDLVFYMMISGLVGSRILYVIHSVPNYWDDPLMIFRVWEGGLVFQGGVIGAVIVAVWLFRKFHMPFFKIADCFAPALSIGHGLGRLGCFFAGCCFGKQCPIDFPLAVTFPKIIDGIAPAGIPLYPTQLTEFAAEMLIFAILVFMRRRKPFDGSVFLTYLILYSILRSLIELWRGDLVRGFVIEPYLSNGQFISIVTIIIAVFLWIFLAKRAKEKTKQP
ncbi:MAG: prolipoprotein diacylglyceryl transferase [bacterium]|nr:prolipoprotein diacylglyceryl transferase [bacterium]MBU1916576.1 prolipoprotein diacylglyceryl transferase [bacterium]